MSREPWWVASETMVKVVGTQDAMVEPVLGEKTESGVSIQPVGLREMELGAFNRLRAVQKAHPLAAGWVAIENGLLLTPTRHWYDLAVVRVASRGHEIQVLSAAVEIPMRYIDAWLLRNPIGSVTIGQVIKELSFEQKAPAQDPHLYLTHGRISRRQLITDAVRLAQAQLPLSL